SLNSPVESPWHRSDNIKTGYRFETSISADEAQFDRQAPLPCKNRTIGSVSSPSINHAPSCSPSELDIWNDAASPQAVDGGGSTAIGRCRWVNRYATASDAANQIPTKTIKVAKSHFLLMRGKF